MCFLLFLSKVKGMYLLWFVYEKALIKIEVNKKKKKLTLMLCFFAQSEYSLFVA